MPNPNRSLRTRLVWAMALLLAVWGVAGVVCARLVTVQKMKRTAVLLAQRPGAAGLEALYRQPKDIFASYAEVPAKFQRGLADDTNCIYHLYAQEGLPYWYFIAAIERQSGRVKHGVVTNY